MLLLFALIGTAAMVAVGWPFYGILLTFAFSQVEFFVELPAGLSVGRLIAAATTLGWLLEMDKTGGLQAHWKRLRSPKTIGPFLLACAGGVLLHSLTMESILAFSSVVLLAMLSVMIEDMIVSERRIYLLVGTVGFSYATLAVVPVAYRFNVSIPGVESAKFVGEQSFARAQGVTNNPNELGLLLSTAIAMLLIMLLKNGNVARALPIIAAIGLAGMGIVLSVSRTHVIGVVTLMGLIGIMRLAGPKRGLIRFALMAVLCAVAGMQVTRGMSEFAVDRLTIIGEGRTQSTVSRFEFIKYQRGEAFGMLGIDPMFGVGLRGFARYAKNNPEELGSHDTVSASVGETGILGTICLMVLVGTTIQRLYIANRKATKRNHLNLYSTSLVLLASLGSLCLTSLGGTVIFYQRQFWLVVGLSYVIGEWAASPMRREEQEAAGSIGMGLPQERSAGIQPTPPTSRIGDSQRRQA